MFYDACHIHLDSILSATNLYLPCPSLVIIICIVYISLGCDEGLPHFLLLIVRELMEFLFLGPCPAGSFHSPSSVPKAATSFSTSEFSGKNLSDHSSTQCIFLLF